MKRLLRDNTQAKAVLFTVLAGLIACAAIALIMSFAANFTAAETAGSVYGNEVVAVAEDDTYVLASSSDTGEAADTEEEPAAEDQGASIDIAKAIGASAAIALAAAVGAVSMAFAICKTNDNIARQPEVESKLRSNMMLGLVFIETAIIYALVVGILVIFVL